MYGQNSVTNQTNEPVSRADESVEDIDTKEELYYSDESVEQSNPQNVSETLTVGDFNNLEESMFDSQACEGQIWPSSSMVTENGTQKEEFSFPIAVIKHGS